MAYVNVPKDLTKVKTKVLFNLTKRQLICFGGGLLIGLPIFFLLKSVTGASVAAMAMIIVMLPAFLLAMYEKNGQPLEKVATPGKKTIEEVGEEAFQMLIDVLSGKMTKNEALGYFGSMDIWCMGPVI